MLLDKTLKKDSIKAEFAVLYNLTNTIHPGQFMFCSKASFDKTYIDLKNSIKTDLSIVDYYRLTATFNGKNKRRTYFTVDRTQISNLLKDRVVFPFSIYKIKDQYYLDKSISENKDYAGLRILKINGKEISSIVNEIQKYIHLEGQNETGLNGQWFRNSPSTISFIIRLINLKSSIWIKKAEAKNWFKWSVI